MQITEWNALNERSSDCTRAGSLPSSHSLLWLENYASRSMQSLANGGPGNREKLGFSHDRFLGGSPGGELGRYWQRPSR
jgi:hypothetical protein